MGAIGLAYWCVEVCLWLHSAILVALVGKKKAHGYSC